MQVYLHLCTVFFEYVFTVCLHVESYLFYSIKKIGISAKFSKTLQYQISWEWVQWLLHWTDWKMDYQKTMF